MKKTKIKSMVVIIILLIAALLLFACDSDYKDRNQQDDNNSTSDGTDDGSENKNDITDDGDDYIASQDISSKFYVEAKYESTQYTAASVDIYAGYLGSNFSIGYDGEDRNLIFMIYREIYKDNGTRTVYFEDIISSTAVYEIDAFWDDKYSGHIIHYSDGHTGRSLPPYLFTDCLGTIEDGEYLLRYTIRAFESDGDEVPFNNGLLSKSIKMTKDADIYRLKIPKGYQFIN